MRWYKSNKKKRGNYKSVFEFRISKALKSSKLKAEYEADTFEYSRPSSYTPDWKIRTGLYIESKGYFAPADRRNLTAFRAQHPDIEIRLLFANANNKLHRKSKITYAAWAEKNGFKWADFYKDGLPLEWFAKTEKDI